MKRRSRRISWMVLGKSPWRFLVGWVQSLLTSLGAVRRNVPETSCELSELLPPLLCLSLSMCTAFEQIHFLFVLLIKMAPFPHLKKCPFSYLQFWLSAMCLQVGTCVCRPKKDAGEEKLKIWRCCKMFHKVGPRNSRPLCSFVSHDPPLMSLQMKVPVLSPKRSQGGTPFCRVCHRNLCMKSKPCLYEGPSQSLNFNDWLEGESAVQLIDWIPWACVCIDWRHWTCRTQSSAQGWPPWGLILWKGLASQTVLEKWGLNTH